MERRARNFVAVGAAVEVCHSHLAAAVVLAGNFGVVEAGLGCSCRLAARTRIVAAEVASADNRCRIVVVEVHRSRCMEVAEKEFGMD